MRIVPALAMAVTCACGPAALAEDNLKSQLTGTWRVTSVYDEFADGSRREAWGAGPLGELIVTPEGTFSFIMAATDRAPNPNAVPTDPVGPSIAYFGTYTVDENRHMISRTLVQSTFPQWKGISQTLKVKSVDADRLNIVSQPIKDPARNMYFAPHLEFARVK